MASSQTRAILIGLFGGVALSALLAGAFFMGRASHGPLAPQVTQPAQPDAPQAEAEIVKPAADAGAKNDAIEAPQAPEVAFAKEFETFLNNFLKELVKETAQYKKDRRILKEAIDPFNLIGTENAEQSYRVFRTEIGPMLRKKGEKLIGLFAKSEKVVQGLLADQPPAAKEKLFSAWKDLEKQHMNGLLDFFENEDKLIAAHEELLKFYFVHSKLYTVDMDTGAIVFSNEKYTAREAELRGAIEKLKKGAGKKTGP